MKNVGKISIVLPCYRAEQYVGDMIGDILVQTYTDWELIVVSNGAGQEAQLAAINSYAAQDSRIQVVSVEQGGVSNARNIGMAKATGQWLTFVDADDRCTSNHLELLTEGCNDETDIVMAGFTQVWTKWNITKEEKIEANHSFDKYLTTIGPIVFNVLWCKLFNNRQLQNWGGKFDPAMAYGEDGLFILSFLLFSRRVNTIKLCGYRYMCNDDASACSRYLESYEEGVRRNYELRQKLYAEVGLDRTVIECKNKEAIYLDTYLFMLNIFKQGTPFSLSGKRREIKRLLFDNQKLVVAMKTHDRSNDSIMLKIYNACYATHSSLLTTMVYELLFKAKYSMKGIYYKIARYLH